MDGKVSLRSLVDFKTSVEEVRKSIIGNRNTVDDERRWDWSYLKDKFRYESIQKLFQTYSQKINHGYFSLFLILEALLSLTNFIVVYIINMNSHTLDVVIVDLVFYSVLAVLPIVGLLLSETYIRKHPKALKIVSAIAFFLLYVADITLPVYHDKEENFRPSYSSHLILACFVFFNVANYIYSLILAIIVSVTHILILYFITYRDSSIAFKRVAADTIYLFCVVALGVYFRLMSEIVKRQSFLDRRAWFESKVDLTYEKEQEEQLMKSILPESLMEKVQENLLKTMEMLRNNLIIEQPVRYITPYKNVTILYADVVNYTKMTSKLKPVVLVETLNDLFGTFDDASDELNVMRIKFLGDCYYCVAGIPPKAIPNHAEACVDLGLKMISIIRTIRSERSIDIDMRIGVHTGNISSGIIGCAKWQFDIWSNDVYIANKMESTGVPGKVHVTKQTKTQLNKVYNITPCNTCSEDALLKQNNIKTYLISPHHIETPVFEKHNIFEQASSKNEIIFLNHLHEEDDSKSENNITLEANEDETINNRRRKTEYLPNRKTIHDVTKIKSTHSITEISEKYTSQTYQRRESKLISNNTTTRRISNNPNKLKLNGSLTNIKRRTAFMQNNVKYKQRMERIDEDMENAINDMPFSKFQQWFKVKEIHPFFLIFRDKKLELKYIQLSDHLFKFYILCSVIILICLIVIENITLPEWDWITLIGYLTLILTVSCLIPLTWTQYVFKTWYRKKEKDDDNTERTEDSEEVKPKNKLIKFLYNSSKFIADNVYVRVLIYLFLTVLCTANVVFEILKCHYNTSDDTNNSSKSFILRFLIYDKTYTGEDINCILPWHMTELCSLVIILSCLFLRVHLWIKTTITFLITVFYSCFIWYFSKDIFQDSETYSPMMDAPIAHIISTAYLALTLHFIDRQTEYLNRLDLKWNTELESEQTQIANRRYANRILLDNILPAHVSKQYMDLNRPPNKFYFKEYKNVAVMFASIVHSNVKLEESTFLYLMNRIICEFDTELFDHKHIEKIKIANWTYMAACGLVPDPENVDEEEVIDNSSTFLILLLEFATKLFSCIERINKDSQLDEEQYLQLRIGISHGEVTAGVVGSKKPLYDIWGDTVNMASRMDSTGELGKIQVTEHTAQILRHAGILCSFRGYIYVKGKSLSPSVPDVPTYYVQLDHKNELILTT